MTDSEAVAQLDQIDEGEEDENIVASEGGQESKAEKSREKRDLESLARGLVEIDLESSSTLSASSTPHAAIPPAQQTISSEISQFVAKRKLVEFADGWERGRRVSLTCRRVIKVRKGMKLG